MSVAEVVKGAVIRVPDHKSLLTSYRILTQIAGSFLVGRWIVEKPLTKAQRQRLPVGLRSRVA